MALSLMILAICFFALGRVISKRVNPTNSFSSRWAKSYLVALAAIPLALTLIAVKEYLAYTQVASLVPVGMFFQGLIAHLVWMFVFGIVLGPFFLALGGWNTERTKPSEPLENTTEQAKPSPNIDPESGREIIGKEGNKTVLKNTWD